MCARLKNSTEEACRAQNRNIFNDFLIESNQNTSTFYKLYGTFWVARFPQGIPFEARSLILQNLYGKLVLHLLNQSHLLVKFELTPPYAKNLCRIPVGNLLERNRRAYRQPFHFKSYSSEVIQIIQVNINM